jgi:hypothetical protein
MLNNLNFQIKCKKLSVIISPKIDWLPCTSIGELDVQDDGQGGGNVGN